MNKKFIASFIFLILSVFLFLFFITNKVPEYIPLFVQSGVDLPWVTKTVIYMTDTIINWYFVIVPLIFLSLFSIILAAFFTKKIEILTIVNIILIILFLSLIAVSYLGMELPVRQIMTAIE
jgi:hypothetical protein